MNGALVTTPHVFVKKKVVLRREKEPRKTHVVIKIPGRAPWSTSQHTTIQGVF